MPERPRCGFIALIGAPNAGKSTLLNALVGAKIAIVTHKVQTTRTRLLGIALHGDAQLIFVDTPGIFLPRRRLDRAMVAAAWSGAGDADRVLLVVDAARARIEPRGARLDPQSQAILDRLAAEGRRAELVLNKIDRIPRSNLLAIADHASRHEAVGEIFMISASREDGTADLRDWLAARLPEGPWLFEPDQISDMPVRLMAAEITREKIYLALHQELPYNSTVETESWTELRDGGVRIEQIVYVERESHKGMVLGRGGVRIKQIREAAQAELAAFLECPVHLFIHVKARPGWQEDPERYRLWGLDYQA